MNPSRPTHSRRATFTPRMFIPGQFVPCDVFIARYLKCCALLVKRLICRGCCGCHMDLKVWLHCRMMWQEPTTYLYSFVLVKASGFTLSSCIVPRPRLTVFMLSSGFLTNSTCHSLPQAVSGQPKLIHHGLLYSLKSNSYLPCRSAASTPIHSRTSYYSLTISQDPRPKTRGANKLV